MDTSRANPADTDVGRSRATAWLCAGVLLVLGFSILLSQRCPSRIFFDTQLYHVPTVRGFVEQWPVVNVYDYLSATTPGFHVVLAGVSGVFGTGQVVWQATVLLMSVVLAWVLGWEVGRGSPRVSAGSSSEPTHDRSTMLVALCLPFLCSMYVLLHSAYALPDNAGWLGVLGMIVLGLRLCDPRSHKQRLALLVLAAFVLTWTVLMRQVHAWSAGVVWVGAWLGTGWSLEKANSEKRKARIHDIAPSHISVTPPLRLSVTLCSLVATLPALALLGLFVRYWHGLVPPRFQDWYPPRALRDVALSPAVMFFLATFSAYGVFFAGRWLPGLRKLWTTRRTLLVAAALGSTLLAVIPPTTYDYDAGRRTGLWNLAQRFPVIAGHTSLFMAPLAVLGGVVLASLLALQRPRERWFFLLTIAGFCFSQSFSKETWQRYNDPLVLMLLALLSAKAARAPVPESRPLGTGRARFARVLALGPVFLAAVFLCVCVLSLTRNASRMSDPPPPTRDQVHHQGAVTPPMELPPIPTPSGKRFWPW